MQDGESLVLAPPGCGKTQILTERIRRAHECGVEYDDMLCLTFTNRAARGMRERIRESIDDREVERVYVGNIHRFCSRFIFDNSLVAAESSVIDDDDVISIIARFENEDETFIAGNFKRRKEYFDAAHLATLMRQIQLRHPKELRLHTESLSKDDIAALRHIAYVQKEPFTPTMMADVYSHASMYREICRSDSYSYDYQRVIMPLLRKMEMANLYHKYKEENNLLDFNDLLVISYEALLKDERREFKRYSWCQVDEVQDLNPLQMALVDMLAPEGTKMFLGDEQQAIFSFMGAKMSTLDQLKERCKDRLFHLKVNHRSPRYLLDVFNEYADKVLGIDKGMLPETDYNPTKTGNELSIMCSSTFEVEFADAAQQAQRLCEQNPGETTAVIVASNADAEIVGRRMREMQLPHFMVSGTDLFSMPEVKLLLAHLSVFANEHNFLAWARLLKGLGVYEQAASARAFVRQLMDKALLPTDLMFRPGSSYVMDFARTCAERDIVVFDTETTGLNVLEDDIVQIAAMKMRGGEIVPGSEFSVFLQTQREIPLMLGAIENPIIEERKHHELLAPDVALRMFMDYVGDAVLVGHNVEYDYHILDYNLRRYLPDLVTADGRVGLSAFCPDFYDTLKLARLLEPNLRQYKLKYLLEVLNLEGENSHLADADVAATCNVLRHCLRKAAEMIPLQREFLSQRTVRERAEQMVRRMKPVYRATQSRLYSCQDVDAEALIVKELRAFYGYLEREGIVQPVRNIEYVFRYVDREIVSRNGIDDKYLLAQIANHIVEMSTLKESDLCGGDVVDERVFVTTVHKAKGLEFDNVIVFDAAADRYPSFFAQGDKLQEKEDARKFYVALTRAKKRIIVMLSGVKMFRGQSQTRQLTKFMRPVIQYFLPLDPNQLHRTILHSGQDE